LSLGRYLSSNPAVHTLLLTKSPVKPGALAPAIFDPDSEEEGGDQDEKDESASNSNPQ